MPYEKFFSLNPGVNRSVFLETISTEGLEIKDVAILRERVFKIMEEKLLFYQASWISPTACHNA